MDLKPYHDAVIAADSLLKEIATEIDGLMNSEKPEDKAKALDMAEMLDEARQDYDSKLKLYESMKKAGAPSEVAKNFVPVSATDPEGEEKPADSMPRSEFNRLDPMSRAEFVKNGGKVED